jgi:hypothetical protein
MTVASKNECATPPATRTAWYYQIHAAGGACGSITMVVVFVVVCVVVDGLVMSQDQRM